MLFKIIISNIFIVGMLLFVISLAMVIARILALRLKLIHLRCHYCNHRAVIFKWSSPLCKRHYEKLIGGYLLIL